MIHHIATIFLIGFSYCANFVRVGTFVMLVHDSSDFLLEVKTLENPFKEVKGVFVDVSLAFHDSEWWLNGVAGCHVTRAGLGVVWQVIWGITWQD